MAPYIVFRCNTCNKILSSVRTFKDHNKRFHNNDEDYELVDKVSGENVYKKKAPMVDIQESGKSKPKFVPPPSPDCNLKGAAAATTNQSAASESKQPAAFDCHRRCPGASDPGTKD